MSSGYVMRPGVPARPKWCHICGWERTSEADFIQQFRGYVADYSGVANPVYQTTCINCGNPTYFPHNLPTPAGLTIPNDWIGYDEGVVIVGMVMGVAASADVVWVPPVLSNIIPSSAKKGSPDQVIAVSGDDFQDGAVVRADAGMGTVDLVTQDIDQQNLRAIIPADMMTQVGTITITVVNPDWQVSAGLPFAIYTGMGP